MMAISLWQPWATLIACGAKPDETRSWAPPENLIGIPIAICAAKKIDKSVGDFCDQLCYGQHPDGGFDLADKIEASFSKLPGGPLMGRFGQGSVLPIGCAVATARIKIALKIGERRIVRDGKTFADWTDYRAKPGDRPPEEFAVPVNDFGDHTPGRWSWVLENVKPINPPPPVKGAQGFFELPPGWLCL